MRSEQSEIFAPSSLAPANMAKRNNGGDKTPPDTLGINPQPPETGFFVDHTKSGGPLLMVPESELQRIDARSADEPNEDESREIDWHGDDAAICIKEQPAIAVFWNRAGSITIAQEGVHGDYDSNVVVQPSNLATLLQALKRLADKAK